MSLSLRSDYRKQRAKHPRSKIIMRVSHQGWRMSLIIENKSTKKFPYKQAFSKKNHFFDNFSTFEGAKRGFLRLYNISHR